MRIIRNIVFIGVIVLAWSVASRTTHAADLTCSGDGTWASTYSGAFAFGDGYDDDYMADLCSYIGNGSFCTDFDICGQCGYTSSWGMVPATLEPGAVVAEPVGTIPIGPKLIAHAKVRCRKGFREVALLVDRRAPRGPVVVDRSGTLRPNTSGRRFDRKYHWQGCRPRYGCRYRRSQSHCGHE